MGTTANHETIGRWIERSRQGDRDAFACLVRQYQGMVSGVALSRTGDVHRSEDLAQETFLLAWQKLAELDDVTKFPGWLCSIARNLARNAARKKSESEQTGALPEATSESTDPVESLMTAERNAMVGAALQKIPENYREPLVLFYRGEQSTKQVADALEITEEAARQRLSRARKFLRKELERQVTDAISSSAPGEFFSLAVIAALPTVAMFTPTGQAVAATVVGTETALTASAMVAAPKSGGGSASLFAASTGWYYVHTVIAWTCSIFALFFWVIGAVPGFWFSIRNAPTLRARRFLILTSLRIHVLAGVVVLYCCLFPAARTYFYSVISGNWDYRFLETAFNLGFFAGLCVVGAVVVFFLVDSPIVYRRILREDAGLLVPKKAGPLEESPLSFSRLQRSFFRSGIVLLLLLLAAWSSFYVWQELERMRMAPHTHYSTGYTARGNFWFFYGKVYVYNAMLGGIFLLVFRQMHRTFLAMAKDETAFAAAPPLVNREMPFSERIFIEWLVSFGFFIAAIFAFLEIVHFIGFPGRPFTLFTILAIMIGGTWLLSVISAAAPAFRWLVNLGGFIPILVASAYCFKQGINGSGIEQSLPDFFTTPQTWPVVFGIMVLDWIIVFGTALTLVFGAFYLRNKWRNATGSKSRFLSRWGFTAVFCVGIVLILLASPFVRSWALPLYYENILYDMGRRETAPPAPGFVEKKIEIATASLDWRKDKPQFQVNALHTRAVDYLKLGKFHESIADYDRVIAVMSDWPKQDRADKIFLPNYYAGRGEARLAAGDARGAIDDFEKVRQDADLWANRKYADVLYNRGYAYEKLGETDKAIADYDEAIKILEQKPYKEQKRVCSVAVRPGYDDEQHHCTLPYQPGFRISSAELMEIRNRLGEAGVPAN